MCWHRGYSVDWYNGSAPGTGAPVTSTSGVPGNGVPGYLQFPSRPVYPHASSKVGTVTGKNFVSRDLALLDLNWNGGHNRGLVGCLQRGRERMRHCGKPRAWHTAVPPASLRTSTPVTACHNVSLSFLPSPHRSAARVRSIYGIILVGRVVTTLCGGSDGHVKWRRRCNWARLLNPNWILQRAALRHGLEVEPVLIPF